jgi:predicted nucleotidyltransferase
MRGYNGHMKDLALLAEQLNVSERTLRRAVNQGVLRADRRSPRRLEMPVGEKLYVRQTWHLLTSIREALRTEGNVRFALLFGSTARGDENPHSDIDLLVEMRDDSLERLADLSTKLEGITGRRVDVIAIGEAEAMPALLAEAIADGRVLVDREGFWPELHSQEEGLRRRTLSDGKRRRKAALAGIDRMLAA